MEDIVISNVSIFANILKMMIPIWISLFVI